MNSKEPTSREKFEQWYSEFEKDAPSLIGQRAYGEQVWQACEAEQAQTIAELQRQVAAKDSLIDSYREMESDCTKQAQTIAELVEALEEILIETNEGQIMHISSEALAKVNGK